MFLEISNLVKQYAHVDGDVYALDGVSLQITKGDFVTITGPSGSGKTTLLLILGGLLRPSFGNMQFEGREIDLQNDKELTAFRSEHIGYVMQNFALIPYLTATENVALAFRKSVNKQEGRQKAAELLKSVGLEDRQNHYPRQLSAGQQQRVAIARALANDPAIILADEPTGNLDPTLAKEILDTLKEINQRQQTTIVMVTHSIDAATYGNVQVQLCNGKIMQEAQ
jgi:putative ABC transport system ATP-binding protein